MQTRKRWDKWIVGYYTIDNFWQIFYDDQIFTGEFPQTYTNTLNKILEEQPKKSTPIVFINNLKRTAVFFEGIELKETKVDSHQEQPMYALYKNAEFRNLDVFCPDAISVAFEDEESPIVKVVNYLQTLGEIPSDVKYTLGHMVKKSIVSGIEDKITEFMKEHHLYFDSIEEYEDMRCGRKSGILWSESFGDIKENITQFDKSSAYSSIMVNDDKFPIGRLRRSEGQFGIVALRETLKNDEWCKIVFEPDAVVPQQIECFRDEDTGLMALEYYDLIDLPVDIVQIAQNNIDKFRFYRSQETGYLCKEFRDRLVEIYLQKQSLPKDDFYRAYAKAKLELVYGKGIQEHYFPSNKELRFYFRRAENFITPQISMHCSAAVRYELRSAYCENNISYMDTDSIHGRQTEQFVKNVEKYNREIEEKNEIAGYPGLEIGVFKLEHANSSELVLAYKQRVVRCSDEVTFSIAGIPKKYIEDYIKNLTADEKMKFFYDGKLYETPVMVFKFEKDAVYYNRTTLKNVILE